MDILRPDQIEQAAQILRDGGLVAFPTETVYGLGALATSDTAVASIYQAKGRPSFNPLIAHVPDLETARNLIDLSPEMEKIAQAFWPGAVTLVGRLKSDRISKLVTAGLDTLAVRVPAHPIALELLRAVGDPLAAPSANPSGRISATNVQHVVDGLGGQIGAVLDGGPTIVGLESTILTEEYGQIICLRPGGIALSEIEAAISSPIKRPAIVDDATPNAPGQLTSHYAPAVKLRMNAETKTQGEVLIGFGDMPESDLNLSESSDLVEAAANLFKMLHLADALAAKTGASGITVAQIPEIGLGLAINDRLRRAAAPR